MRRLNQLQLEPHSACLHCDREFDRPYQRMPEIESPGTVVLKCHYCGLFTVFVMEGAQVRPMREPGE